ncbi:PaiB family negative transcriptional regulator [Pseudonocardia hierapolitana]|uniref:PaiB family negative transcriptional regulator n=1 Tax=Pseudonocardia hierapolitana TaxID=1128676 RepID=A0A561T035_9PSEU|nr:FMN-binding negative transcriptional regulator [Pseudonocardia hierapolitana]TWF80457.1 PaiB family negative transcriptional regulator [Pseudonocardia hierapolitana]
MRRELDPYRIDVEAAALVAAHPLATLVTPFGDTIHISHLPLLLQAQAGERAVVVGHLSRANPHGEALGAGAPTVAVFHGPHAYISASWYEGREMAPTWGYQAVHAHGTPALSPDDAHTLRCVRMLVEHMERGRPGQWRVDELGEAGVARRVPRIVGFEIPVARAETRWMLGEGERPSDLTAAIAHLRAEQPGLVAAIAAANYLAP